MIACFDVHYFDTYANAAAVLFPDWRSETPANIYQKKCLEVGDYQPGQFYQRELKPLVALIDEIEEDVDTWVLDAYCHLSAELAPGLGQYVAEKLPGNGTVIGVAKNRFKDTNHAIEVFRGDSIRPLFVTSIGIDYAQAADCISAMHGPFRVPTLLKLVDHLARQG